MPETSSSPLGYRARASIDGRVVAETSDAAREDAPNKAPTLWFPSADVDADLLAEPAGDRWQVGVGELAGYVGFDHDIVEVDIIDGAPGDDERDVTLKRFPTWGDASELIAIMDVHPIDDTRYRSEARADWRRPVVEGSQMLGQSIVAAARHTPGRRVVSASMAFTRSVDARFSYDLELDDIAGGRTFTTLGVRATQGERVCAAGTVLLNTPADDVMRHSAPMPDVAGPYDAEPHDMSVTGRDLRVVDGAYTGDPDAPVGPPLLDAWVRFRDVPDDPAIHAGLLAQFSGHMSIAAAMRPHAGIGQDQAHATLSTAPNAISLSFHADARVDAWVLYHHHSTFAGDGMTHSECRVYDESGRLLASYTVDAMVRGFDRVPSAAETRTAL